MLIPQLPPDLPLWQDFTPCEWKVIMLLADDLSTDQLMDRLCIERKGVEKHKTNLANKLSLSGRDALNRYARQNRPDLITWYPILRRKPKPKDGRRPLPNGEFPPPA